MKFILRPRAALCAALAGLIAASIPAAAQRYDDGRDRGGERHRFRDRDADRSRGDRDERRPAGGVWESLGVFVYKPEPQHAIIKLDMDKTYGRLGVVVREGSADLQEVVVTYGNGASERFPIGQTLDRNNHTRALDFIGEGRRIRQVDVVYKATQEVSMEVFADPYRESRPGPRWQQLGCESVSLFDFADVIRVAGQGPFRQIKLTADGNNVRLDRLRVVYGNGAADEISVRSVLPDGTETRALDLIGERRNISRIELFYLPQINAGPAATVCAFGS